MVFDMSWPTRNYFGDNLPCHRRIRRHHVNVYVYNRSAVSATICTEPRLG